jgi:acyl carrier protein
VPVVVLRSLGDSSIKALQQAVLQHMGAAYVPDEVITLTELGLADFPKTISGKVQKSRLAELVLTFRDQRDHKQHASQGSIHDVIIRAYYKSTGIPVENLDLQTPVTNFADSISFMRVRDALRKQLGFTLTVQEMMEYPNIESQIRLLQGRTFNLRMVHARHRNLPDPHP